MTYTDIENRVNDTVQVGNRSRITTQKVRMLNEENEYWGSMTGTFTGTIIPQVLSNTLVMDSRIGNSTVVCDAGDVDLTALVYDVISAQSDINQISSDVIKIDNGLSNYELTVSADNRYSALCSEIDIIRSGLSSTWKYLEHNLSDQYSAETYTAEKIVNMLSSVKTGLERIFGVELPPEEPETGDGGNADGKTPEDCKCF